MPGTRAIAQTLQRLVAPKLLAEWEHRLDDFERRGWRNRVEPIGDSERRVRGPQQPRRRRQRSRRRADRGQGPRLRRRPQRQAHQARRAAFTRPAACASSGRCAGVATAGSSVSIEQGAEGSHALQEEVVATPWADEQGMRDEALVEGAVADAVPEGTSVADVADLQFDGDGRAAALDLSLADGRFAPDVLEVAARRAVAAWADAVDGSDAELQGDRPPRGGKSATAPGRFQWRRRGWSSAVRASSRSGSSRSTPGQRRRR